MVIGRTEIHRKPFLQCENDGVSVSYNDNNTLSAVTENKPSEMSVSHLKAFFIHTFYVQKPSPYTVQLRYTIIHRGYIFCYFIVQRTIFIIF